MKFIFHNFQNNFPYFNLSGPQSAWTVSVDFLFQPSPQVKIIYEFHGSKHGCFTDNGLFGQVTK